jgi:hypothetical protein
MLKQFIKFIWIPALLVMLVVCAQPAQAKDEHKGFIYGRVVTESGSEYTGFLRWGNQEAFWDDLFHSAKENFPFLDYMDEDDLDQIKRSRRKQYSFFKKWKVTVDDHGSLSRMFICRFGDIERIEPRGEGEADLLMKSGTEFEVEGAADDVTSKIHVKDAALGMIDLHWDKIELIEFKAVPRDEDPGVWRLYGTVDTDEGAFKGYIQWDKRKAQPPRIDRCAQ